MVVLLKIWIKLINLLQIAFDNMRKISVLGDSNVDLLLNVANPNKLADPQLFCGGSSANVATGLSKLGNEVCFFGAVGNDIYGKHVQKDLLDNIVNIDGLYVLDNYSTATVIAVIDKTGERNLFVWPTENAAHSQYSLTSHDTKVLNECNWLHVSGISLRENPTRSSMLDAMRLCKNSQIKVSFDLNLRIELWGLDNEFINVIFEAIDLSDYIFGNLEEEYYNLFNTNHMSDIISNAAYKNKVFITREGSKGATAYFEDEIYSAESFDVKPIDTVGAGDAFNTGFIHSMLNLNNLESALRFGNAVAGYKLQGEGARYLPNLSQLENFIK